MSPFVALYGHEPRHWGIDATYTCTSPSLEEWLAERQQMQQNLQHNLNHARQYMKNQADKKRTECTFVPGEEVFVKLQPYVQVSVLRCSNNKLAFRYFGPYTITKCINPVAYEVALPPESKIHPIFHVSQLRNVLRPGTPVSSSLPVITGALPSHVKILGHRWRQFPTRHREQVQVQWQRDSKVEVTWEDKVEMQHKFPDALAWGQANFQGRGDVHSSTNIAAEENELGLTTRSAQPKRLIQPNRRHVGPGWTK